MGLVLLSGGTLQTLDERLPLPWPTYGHGQVTGHDGVARSYAEIWRTQPNVRTVVSFLARNIASLSLHTFRRVGDTDRRRLGLEHPLVRTLAKPNPQTTPYRLFSYLVHDLGIYDRAYWLKLRRPDGEVELRRLPPQRVIPHGGAWNEVERFELFTRSGAPKDLDPSVVVYFRGYDPDGVGGSPPMEALRLLLAEDLAAGVHRTQLWKSGARISGWIGRDAGLDWSPTAKGRFMADWRAAWTGEGEGAAGTALLEDGMVFHEAGHSAESSQYIEARKLTREEAAAAYFIPPPMVGILDHATFSNITEQHKMLYQDTLGPWLTDLQQDIALQLVPEFPDVADVYQEFNIAQKLAGSFEEQAGSFQTAVGAPWLTRNEARARQNLPQVEGGDELVTPLNVIVGGQASPTDSAPPPKAIGPGGQKALGPGATARARLRAAHADRIEKAIGRFAERQARTVSSRLGAGKASAIPPLAAAWGDPARWDAELAALLLPLLLAAASDGAGTVLADHPDVDFEEALMVPYLEIVAAEQATATNVATLDALRDAVARDDWKDQVAHVFEQASTTRAADLADSTTTSSWHLGISDAGRAAGLKTKTWRVRSSRPRKAHARLDGVSVAMEDEFPNGARWPGDRKLKIEERARCSCDLEVSK